MEYEDDSVACRWPGPVNEPFVCYDTAVESLLSSDTRLRLVVGILNLERSNGAHDQSWVSRFQVGTPTQQPAGRPAGNGPASPAVLGKPAQVITIQGFHKGDFMGFALGRVMAEGTADRELAAADTAAQLLQLSSRMFRFAAQPPACSSQQADQVAASKKIVMQFLDDAAANPLAQARDSGSAGPNAAYLPLSDNGTGKVYVAVVALTDITAGAEITVDKGAVSYSRPVHDRLLQAVLSKADNLQLGPGSVMGQAQHRQPSQQQQGKQQRRVQQNQQQPSVALLQAEVHSADAAADPSFQQAADSSNASKSSSLAADDLLKLDGTTGMGVAASADIAQHAAAATTANRTAPSPAEKQRKAEGAAAVPVLPDSAASPPAKAPSALRPSGMSPRCKMAAPPAVQIPARAAGAAAVAAAQSPVAATLKQKVTPDGSCPAATPERQPGSASKPPAPAVAGSGAAAISSNPIQDSRVGLRSRGRQAAKRAVTANHDLFSSAPSAKRTKATKQAQTSSQRSQQQQQLDGRIQSHVQQLSSNEMGLQKEAANSLRLLAYRNKKNSSCIVAAGAVQPLVALLNSTDSGCQTAAADALFNLLSNHNTTCNALLAADGIPPLVTMLTSRFKNCQIAAADLLAQLATTKDVAAAVLGTAGSFDAAVKLLRNTDQDVVAAVLHLLIKLLSNRGDTAIAFSGVVPAVYEKLSSKDNAEVQLTAAETLAVMGDIDPSAVDGELLRAAAATVVELLCSSSGYRALEAAASIADIHPHLEALQEVIPRVVALLGSNKSSIDGTPKRAVVREAARFCCNMAQDDRNLDQMAAADSLKLLIELVQSPHALCEHGMWLALGAVYRLIDRHPQRQQAAEAAGIIGTAVELLLVSSHTDVLYEALDILWSLAETSRTVQTEVRSLRAMSKVVELLGHSDIRIQHNAAGLLMVLVRSSTAIKVEAVKAGAIPPLVHLLVNSDDPSVQEDGVGALESLAVGSAENQAAIAAEVGAVERLQELVSSDSSNVELGAAAVLKLLKK